MGEFAPVRGARRKSKMEKMLINAQLRTVFGKKVGALRRQGFVPGVIYGHKTEPIAVLMNARELARFLMHVTPSSIVTISIDGKEHTALVRELQRNYIRNEVIHVDFQEVSMKEKIRARIFISLTGTAPAVKAFDGIVLHEREWIEVEALPADLPERIHVDLSSLENIGDAIRVSDLNLGDKITIHAEADDVIVSISGVKAEAAEEEGEEAAGDEPEVVEKGKKEEDAE